MDLLFLSVQWQIKEESEVFDNRSSYLVHTHCLGYIQAFYQVILENFHHTFVQEQHNIHYEKT